MISDVLNEATERILHYRDNPTFRRCYSNVAPEINFVVDVMDNLQRVLNDPTASYDRRSFFYDCGCAYAALAV